MKDVRWQGIGLALAAGLVIPGIFLTGAADPRPGVRVTLAGTAPAGSSTTLQYHAWVSAKDRIDQGDDIRIIDPPGLVQGSAQAPAGWSVSTEPTSPTVDRTYSDDPALPNLIFRHVDSRPITGPLLLKGFTARSTSGAPRAVRSFVAQSTRTGNPGKDLKVESSGMIGKPGTVPEPASLVSSCLGVIVLGIVYARRHRHNRPVFN